MLLTTTWLITWDSWSFCHAIFHFFHQRQSKYNSYSTWSQWHPIPIKYLPLFQIVLTNKSQHTVLFPLTPYSYFTLQLQEPKPKFSTTMKFWSKALAAIALTLSLLSSTWCTGNRVEVHPSKEVYSKPLITVSSSSHQALQDLQARRKNPSNSNKVDSSLRAIPPSNSNPTQNKWLLATSITCTDWNSAT